MLLCHCRCNLNSLLRKFVNYGQKKFHNIGPCSYHKKTNAHLSTALEVTSYLPSDFSTLMTAPLRLQLKVTFGAPLALQIRTPVLPLSEADLAMDGEVSILGLSVN
jgi:hypothetical protein